MDVRAYYQYIREIESQLPLGDVVLISLATADGGAAGRALEASRRLAAKMIVERRARVATDDEVEDFRKQEAAAQAELARRSVTPRVSFTVPRPEDSNGAL